MLIAYMFKDPSVWIVPWVIQAFCYIRILRKMGRSTLPGLVPVLGDWSMAHDLFRNMRSFWRPAINAAVMIGTAAYIGTDNEYGLILKLVGFAVYGVFLVRLYYRLARQFGKSRFFAVLLILIPIIFLPVLAFGKSTYLGKPEFKPQKELIPGGLAFRRAVLSLLSMLEIGALGLGCFLLTVAIHPARPIAQYMINSDLDKMKSIDATDEFVSRTDTIGADYLQIVEKQRTRDYFYPDHSGDKKVVVMEYIIGSNLEDGRGSASINIAQMKDATAEGDGVDFVIQAGGSERWFTDGIEDSTVGRYLISDGKLTKEEALDSRMCMSEPDNLKDFIIWTKENYPADRYMLALWDHGGGFSSGYGVDDLNSRDSDTGAMEASEIIKAIRKSGVKFDVIGFDACLMQNIEYANALEPYADYYLASEETEPAYGWFYTAAFGRLAEDPTLSTEKFGEMMVSSYDQLYLAMSSDNTPQPQNTLSLVDLTLVKPVYKQLTSLYGDALGIIKDSPAVFANLSAARSKAYQFYDKEQVDMINFLTSLKKADYRQQVAQDDELDEMVKMAQACVVCHNKYSADGINGIALEFPYEDIDTYTYEYEQLKAVKYKVEEKFFNNFCSIMASQRMRQSEDEDAGGFFSSLLTEDYSDQKWYVDGFEDYDTTDLFIDIPVQQTAGGYLPELPEKTWDTILDTSVMAYIVTDDGLMYIGTEYTNAGSADGHPLVAMEDRWVNIGGNLVCYEAETPMETDDGKIYKGTVRAKLNDSEKITLHIEWESSTDDTKEALKGRITGYSLDEEKDSFFMKKGLEQLVTGDKLEFLFDYYDEQGELKKTEVYGDPLTVVTDGTLSVSDEPLEAGTELEYYGVLTDVYQRQLMTEAIRETVEPEEQGLIS